MATALVDLYGNGPEQFDQIILPEDYRPLDDEEFMRGADELEPRPLQRWIIIVVEVVDADDLLAAIQQRPGDL